MPELALVLYALYLALAFGLRSLLQWRTTGSTGFVGIGGRPGSAEWLAGALFAAALAMGFAAPLLALFGVLGPVAALDGTVGHVAGAAIALAGIALTLYAQVAMGSAWRIGVDHSERTELVTSGPFAVVRNPIFAAMIPTAVGLTLLVPSVLALAGLAAGGGAGATGARGRGALSAADPRSGVRGLRGAHQPLRPRAGPPRPLIRSARPGPAGPGRCGRRPTDTRPLRGSGGGIAPARSGRA